MPAVGGGRSAPAPAAPKLPSGAGGDAFGRAVANVFRAQPPAVQQRIVQAARANPAHPASQALLGHLSGPRLAQAIRTQPRVANTPVSPLLTAASRHVTVGPNNPTVGVPKFLDFLSPSRVYSSGGTGAPSGDNGGFGLGSVSPMFGGLKGAQQVGKNAVSDLYHLPKMTVEGLYGVGDALVHGHFGNAFHMLVDPFVHTFLHPGQSFYHHPVDTALQFLGPEAAVGRIAGGAARAGLLGERAARFADTARVPLRLPDVAGHAGADIAERSYSRNLLTQAGQRGIERLRGENANIVTRPGFHLRRIANEMTAVRQMVGRTERGLAMRVMLKQAPHPAVRNVVSHILQGVVRTPETAVHDLEAEIRRLEPHAAVNIRKPSVAMARAQIKDLRQALANQEHLPDAFRAAQEIRQHLKASDAYLVRLGLLDQHQAERRAIAPYAMAHMGAKWDAGHGLMLGDNPLSNERILQHLKDNRVPDPAYVGHYPGKVAPWRFYQAYRMARGSLGRGSTFEAFRIGGYDHTYNGLVAQTARTAEAITKAGLHDRIVSRFGVTRPESMLSAHETRQLANIRAELKQNINPQRRATLEARVEELKNFTPVEARSFAHAATHQLTATGDEPVKRAIEYVPITRAPHSALDHVRDLQNPHELVDRINEAEIAAVDRAVRDVQSRGDSKRNVVLVPKDAIDQFREQFKQQGGISRELGRFTQQFRRTVLPYSTHWMFQIGTEAALRGLLNGVVDPRNLAAGHQLVRQLENSAEGRAALSEMVNAVFYNQHDTLGIHHEPNAVLRGAKAMPVTRQLIDAHNHYADFVGAAMSRFEHEFRLMGLGKLARQQIQEFTGEWQKGIRVEGQNVAHLADQLKANPNLVAKFGRQIDSIFGKYNKFSPKTRAAIQSFAPFLPWYLNAARFVLWHLPVRSPVASSLLANLRLTMYQDVQDGKQLPLDDFSMEQLARLSPFGIGAYPTAAGMSPVGAMALKDATGIFLPQVEGSIYNLTGSNSFGEGPLKGPNGDVKPGSGAAVRSALENFAEALIPGIRMGREALEGTDSSYGTSTLIQPQGKGQQLGAGIFNRIFNPLYSFEKAKSYTGGSGGNSGGWGATSSTGGWGGSSSSGGWG